MINPTKKLSMEGKKILVMTVIIKQDGKSILNAQPWLLKVDNTEKL